MRFAYLKVQFDWGIVEGLGPRGPFVSNREDRLFGVRSDRQREPEREESGLKYAG
jgi:hypothetical protein